MATAPLSALLRHIERLAALGGTEPRTDRQLLDLRFCDLPLRIQGTRLEQRIDNLYRELDTRSLAFRRWLRCRRGRQLPDQFLDGLRDSTLG